jgi:3-isopropylmalate/(R)-2-methylmalate dehydratase small subunit
MQPLRKFTGKAAPLDRADIDTDQIIPKQFLKRIERSGYGDFLFYDWRKHSDGSENSEFILNQPRYHGATILLVGRNFGCGSSREHAVWALRDYGFRAVIAPSFADIFSKNAINNGLAPIALPEPAVKELMGAAPEREGYSLQVDLASQSVSDSAGHHFNFSMEQFSRRRLLEGLDEIALSLVHEDAISGYEARRPRFKPAPSN